MPCGVAVQYVASSGIAGAIVECGVWRGGSVMVVARTLMDLDRTDYELYLFDTFSGMPAPGELDRDSARPRGGRPAEPVTQGFARLGSELARGDDGSCVQRWLSPGPYPLHRGPRGGDDPEPRS